MKKKFFKRAVFILLTGSLSYCGIILLAIFLGLTHWIPNFYSNSGGIGQFLLRMRELRKVEDVNLVFVGSSHAYRGFDPREFSTKGIAAFNMGSTSQTPFNSYFLLKRYLPVNKPEVVVMELYWDMLAQDGLESTIDIVSNTEIEGEFVEMVAASKNTLAFKSLLITALQRLHTPLDYVEQKEIGADVYIKGGFTQTLLEENSLSEEHLAKLDSMVVEPSDFQLNYLNKIIGLCKERDIKLVFVVAPVTTEYKAKVINYMAYSEILSTIAAKNEILFLDYNHREDFEMETRYDFYDQDHLTQRGVRKFNEQLIRDLEEFNILNPEFATLK